MDGAWHALVHVWPFWGFDGTACTVPCSWRCGRNVPLAAAYWYRGVSGRSYASRARSTAGPQAASGMPIMRAPGTTQGPHGV